MKLSIIEKALASYIRSAECSATDVDEVLTAIQECAATRDRYRDDDIKLWKENVQIIPLTTLMDFLNITTYDVYGKMQKTALKNRIDNIPTERYTIPLDQYAYECRKQMPGCELLTNSQLECGYEYIRDLWFDNEADGCHNDDGTFQK